jgi:hypothetical protein
LGGSFANAIATGSDANMGATAIALSDDTVFSVFPLSPVAQADASGDAFRRQRN